MHKFLYIILILLLTTVTVELGISAPHALVVTEIITINKLQEVRDIADCSTDSICINRTLLADLSNNTFADPNLIREDV